MDAKALLLTAIELLKIGATDNGLYGRMTRLTGHALFALGRLDFERFISPEMNREWLRASGEDIERDGLLQLPLRDQAIKFKFTRSEQFNAIFGGKHSLPLYQAASEFFRQIHATQPETERNVLIALGIACLVLAEDRYSIETRSLRECIERKSTTLRIVRTQEDFLNFQSLLHQFGRFRAEFTSTGDSSQQSGSFFSPQREDSQTEQTAAEN